MRVIPQSELHETTIADTGVTVAELVRTFIRTQDGRLDRDMEDEHGHDLGATVVETRAALLALPGIL